MSTRSAAPSVGRHDRGLQTRAEIVVAAERRFAERSFEATRLDDITVDVGTRHAAIFYHFGESWRDTCWEFVRGGQRAGPGTGLERC